MLESAAEGGRTAQDYGIRSDTILLINEWPLRDFAQYFMASPVRIPSETEPGQERLGLGIKARSMNIVIIGSGIFGLACAHALQPHHDVTVFEADYHAGGHARTVTVHLPSGEHRIDTGFIVYNEGNYPLLCGAPH